MRRAGRRRAFVRASRALSDDILDKRAGALGIRSGWTPTGASDFAVVHGREAGARAASAARVSDEDATVDELLDVAQRGVVGALCEFGVLRCRQLALEFVQNAIDDGSLPLVDGAGVDLLREPRFVGYRCEGSSNRSIPSPHEVARPEPVHEPARCVLSRVIARARSAAPRQGDAPASAFGRQSMRERSMACRNSTISADVSTAVSARNVVKKSVALPRTAQ